MNEILLFGDFPNCIRNGSNFYHIFVLLASQTISDCCWSNDCFSASHIIISQSGGPHPHYSISHLDVIIQTCVVLLTLHPCLHADNNTSDSSGYQQTPDPGPMISITSHQLIVKSMWRQLHLYTLRDGQKHMLSCRVTAIQPSLTVLFKCPNYT